MPTDDKWIEECCEEVLKFTGSLAPEWANRIAIARSERNWTSRQFLGAMIGWMLDNGYHLTAPQHPFFQPGAVPMVEKPCELCGKLFKPIIPGQRFCSETCGISYLKKMEAKAA